MVFTQVSYDSLNAKQKEIYNFQLLSARLATCGYQTIRLSDDWKGADLLASKFDGPELLRIQLKSRLTIRWDYQNQGIWIAFRVEDDWFLFPHDEMVAKVLTELPKLAQSKSWAERGGYSWPYLTKKLVKILADYHLPSLSGEELYAKFPDLPTNEPEPIPETH